MTLKTPKKVISEKISFPDIGLLTNSFIPFMLRKKYVFHHHNLKRYLGDLI